MPTNAAVDQIKALHIIGDSQYGGVIRIITGLARVAKAAGCEIDVLTTNPAVQEALRRESIGIVDLDVIRRQIRPIWDVAGLYRLYRFLRRERYTIVHTHTSKGGFVGRLAAWLAGVPIVLHTMHGFAIHEQSSAPVRMIYAALERLAARWCHRIITVSEFHRRWALELGICPPQQIQAIPNGITPDRLPESFDRARLRRELGVGEGERMILSTTRLAMDKGIQYLVEAAALLPRTGVRYRVTVAGDGPARPYLERLARSRGVSDIVSFLGFRNDIAGLLAAADVLVLPSLREGLSISLLEAMAAGRPIVATSIGSQRELASQANMALLVPPAEPAALAEAIERLAADPALAAHLAEQARSLFESRYTEDRMWRAYRDLYLDLLERTFPHSARPAPDGAAVVRNATVSDLPAIVAIHRKAFDRFFLTRMGSAFLRRYYELVLRYRTGTILVSERRGAIDGFVCGFAEPAEFYRAMWRHRLAFVLPSLAALLRHPRLAADVMNAVRRIQTSASQGRCPSCEISSIAVRPEAAGQGVGRRLLEAFLDQPCARRADYVYLTTDADSNDAVNALYRDIGFRHSRRFLQKKGRWMNEYIFHRALAQEPAETQL